jgi:hypothetical protein
MHSSTITVAPVLRKRALVAAALALVGLAATVTARDASAQKGGARRRACNEATLRGSYGFLASGWKPVPPPLGGGLERFTAAGFWSFDGRGSFTFEAGAALHGEVTGTNPDPEGIVGSYTVNSNCTGTLSWAPAPVFPPIEYTIAIVDEARQVKAATITGLSTLELVQR